MAVTLWERISEKLKNDIKIIFKDYSLDELNDMQKRQLIFNYLYDNVSYNKELFTNITAYKLGLKEKIKRNTPQELYDVIFKQNGICSSICQYYKLLLDEVNISSYYVACSLDINLSEFGFDEGYHNVNHALSVVYDKDSNTYSFDDLTLSIINKDNNSFFNFDLEKAHLYNIGFSDVLNGMKFKIIDESYIDMVSGRRDKTSLRNKITHDIPKVKAFLNENQDFFDIKLEENIVKKNNM